MPTESKFSLLALPLLCVAACGSPQSESHETPAPAGEIKDSPRPANPAECNSSSYHHTEAKNAAGPGKCSDDCDCDGTRTCVSGACQGTAR